MEKDFEIDSIVKNLKINPNVIECLRECVPYQDAFKYFVDSNTQTAFWTLIDESLPTNISMELHSIEATFPCIDRDFPPDTLGPYFQDFWAAHNIQQSGEVKFQCPYAFTQFTTEFIDEILNSIGEGWARDFKNNENWTLCEKPISKESLLMMCNSFISSTKPYLFCDINDIREAYLECDKALSKVEKPFDLSQVYMKLRTFSIETGDNFASLLKGAKVSYLPKFTLPKPILNGLRSLMAASGTYFEKRLTPPEVTNCEEWIMSRSSNLDKQMNLPFENRYAFVETSQMLQARAGRPSDQPFEKNSVAELLFTNNNGDVMPLPYVTGKAEIPSGSSVPFCHAAFRKFVSRQLLEKGYTTTTDSVIDILADFSQIYVKKVAQDAAEIKKRSKASKKDILIQALTKNQSDIVTNPHLSNKTT